MFSPCLSLPAPNSNFILLVSPARADLSHGDRTDGRVYIWIVNSLFLLSVHTTCHRRFQAKVAVTAVV